MNTGGKVAVGAGVLAAGGLGAYLLLHRAPAAAVTSSGGGSSGTTPTIPGLEIGQPFVTNFAAPVRFGPLHRPGMPVRLLGRVRVASLGGLARVSSVTAQPGQVLNVPLSVTNVGPATLYFSAHGYTWEGGVASGSSTLAIPSIGTVAVGGHLTEAEGSSSAATGSASANGGTWNPTLQSEGTLAYTGFPMGAWVHLHVYQDSAMSQEVSGSPVAAWTGPFLTVALPGLSSLIQFGIGSPTAARVKEVR